MKGTVAAIALTLTLAGCGGGGGDKATAPAPAPVSGVSLSQGAATLNIGATLTLAATPSDAAGNTLSGRPISWSTSNPAFATVSAGVVTGVAVGVANITATVEGKTASAAITVVDPTVPSLTSVSPDTLVAGATATVTGTNLTTSTGPGSLTVGGVAATVTAATATQLTITVPGFPCQSTQAVPVVVTTPRGTAAVNKVLRVAVRQALPIGGSVLITDVATIACNELTATGGRYLVSVFSTSTVPGSTASFELRGAAGPSGSSAPIPAVAAAIAPNAWWSAVSSGSAQLLRDARRTAGQSAHLAQLERDRAMTQRLGSILGYQHRQAARSSPAATAVPLTVGTMTTLRVRNQNTTCATYDTVRARVVYVGSKSVVLEDSLAFRAGSIDSDYVDIGKTFDSVMYPIVTANFGDPLKSDPYTDNNGRILMLFTPKINKLGNVSGFISPCDFYPPESRPELAASNRAEMFYGVVPEDAPGTWTLSLWRELMKSTVIHEAKHIASYAERLTSPNFVTNEASWLEEGTAQVASELYARTLYGTSWKSNATYLQTIYCDVRGRLPGRCAGAQLLVWDQLHDLEAYYPAHETKSYLSSGSADVTIYGSAWLFARWVADQYAASEGGFYKSLVQDATRAGVANITDKTGHSFVELSGWFSLANIADDYPGLTPPPNARWTVPSWNIPDLLAGFHADFPNYYPASPILTHPVSFGAFAVAVPALAGGAAAFFDISGAQAGAQLLDLHAENGAALPSSTALRVGIVRVQ